MKTAAKVKIPKGWRKLRKGVQIHKGDKLFQAGVDKRWTPIPFEVPGYITGKTPTTYIRRAANHGRTRE